MSTPDPFEEKLKSLPCRSLPPEWRAQILGKTASARPKGPPRWLACGWGVGIAASLALHLATPGGKTSSADPTPLATNPPLRQHAELLQTWLALNDVGAYPNPRP